MLPKSTISRIVPILRKDARRTLRMRLPGFPKVYYTSFLLRDIEWFNTWSSSGSVYRRRSDHTRNVYCDMRVGSYKYDQTSEGGLGDNDGDRESVSHVTLPIDDRNFDALRLALWRLSEAKFKEALKDYAQKDSARIAAPDSSDNFYSFTKLKPIHSVKQGTRQFVDEQKWEKFVKDSSKWISELPHVSTSWVEFDSSQDSRVFVSTENRVIVQHQRIFSLNVTLRKLTDDGASIEQELVINCSSINELPNARKFRRMVLEKHRNLMRVARARPIHSFSGPVLLYPRPSGLLFHEAIGHRLEGSRLLASDEGQTFKGVVGNRIINVNIDVSDNPLLKKFNGELCVGAYDFDDEGTPAKNAILIENGILRGFLNTRAQNQKRSKYEPNGHARSKKFQRPVSRMGVLIVKGRETVSIKKLRELLIEEIKRQKKPFGLIVYETAGGETDTTSYDFQAFSGEICHATMVFPNGQERVCRGVNIVGTPLQSLNNIIAVGDTQELDNAFCGAESGLLPVSTISPAVLLSNLELQSKNEELVSQNILPRPKL